MNIFERAATSQSVQAAREALRTASERLDSMSQEGLPPEVRERLPEAQAHATRQAARVTRDLARQKRALEHDLGAVMRSRTGPLKRLAALRDVVDRMAALVAPHAACKKGCVHCCHIPVGVTALEAQLIGQAIGVAPREVTDPVPPSQRAYGYEHACPFLEEGRCSIYEARPIACRLHFNMDRDELLCRLIPPTPVPVPLADMRQLQTSYVALCEDSVLGDIRDFFPTGRRKPAPKSR